MSHTTVYINRIPGDATGYIPNPYGGDQLGWISAAIMAGTSIFGSLFGGLFAPCGGAQVACGLQGITSAGNQVIQGLQQINAALASGQVPPQQIQQAVAEAQALASALGDSSKVYQAKNGKDAAALAQFKQQAAQLLQQIQATAQTAMAQAATSAGIDPATGQQIAPSIGGISLSTLLLFGGGALGLVLLLRK
jgi:hypothetical protein